MLRTACISIRKDTDCTKISSKKTIRIDGLLKDSIYRIADMNCAEIARMSVEQLAANGFTITIEEEFGGHLYEVALEE